MIVLQTSPRLTTLFANFASGLFVLLVAVLAARRLRRRAALAPAPLGEQAAFP
eukprot:m.135692 g.135692  ORF g.135692 m.135692 type:complete len:53 (+) comp52459_c0_seq2:41-199(+)